MLAGGWGDGQRNFEGADLVRGGVEDADPEGDLPGRQVELLGELEWRFDEFAVFVGTERQVHGLVHGGYDSAVDVVGRGVEF